MRVGLQFVDVTRRFGEQRAVTSLSLDCPEGMTCFVGPNGAGKSTALAMAAGLLAPTSGRILVDGTEVDLGTPPASTGYLPQKSAFHRSLLVSEIVEFSVAARAAGKSDLRSMIEVTGVREILSRPVGELSGGWVRRLGLFSALLAEPRLLLLDEPFVGLDPETHDRLLDHLAARLAAGATILLASHDFEALDVFRPRVCVLDEGSLQAVEELAGRGAGSSRDVYRRTLGAEPLSSVAGGQA